MPVVDVGLLGADVVVRCPFCGVPGDVEVAVARVDEQVVYGQVRVEREGRGGCEPWRLVRGGRAVARGVHGAHVVAVLPPVGESGERVGGGGRVAARDGRPRTPAGQVARRGVVVVDVVLVSGDGRIRWVVP